MTSMRLAREPQLSEMLKDPVVQAVMARDGVEPEEVIALMAEMRHRLRSRRLRKAA